MNSHTDPFTDRAFIDRFEKRRCEDDSVNTCIDEPTILSRVEKIRPKEVLELGCALGHLTKKIAAVSGSVTGIDKSQPMIARAKKENSSANTSYICSDFLSYSHHKPVDMIVSGMAMHLIEDFDSLCRSVHNSLQNEGTFIFSQRHPIRTCNPNGERNQKNIPSWLVEEYFSTGARYYSWLGTEVVCYHRSIENIVATLTNIGFQILEVVEPRPSIDQKSNRITEHSNVPSVIFFNCKKI